MPSRPPGPWGLVTWYGRLDQKEFSNEFWLSISAGGPAPGWDQYLAAQALYTSLTTNWAVPMATATKLLGVNFQYNDGTGTLGIDYYQTITGSGSGPALPEDVAVVVQKNTANQTRHGRGRWFLCGTANQYSNGSYLTATGIGFFQQIAIDLKTAIVDQGVTWSPAHHDKSTNTLRPITNDPVISLLSTNRRRRFRF